MEIDVVYNDDCAQGMEKLPDESIDLTITSPPYDDLRDYGGYTFDFEKIAKELFRVTKKGGVVVWVVGDSVVDGGETGTSFRQALYFKDIGFRLHDTMIYEKSGAPYPEKIRYYQVFEYMFVFSKGKPKTVNLLRDKRNKWAGTTNFGTPTRRQKDGSLKISKSHVVKKYGVRPNIWRYNTGYNCSTSDDIAYQHPAIFPDALARDHILSWSNEGDIVLDPMCGSGTTLKMAKKLGRYYIGFEINPEYIELTKQRLKEIQLEFNLGDELVKTL